MIRQYMPDKLYFSIPSVPVSVHQGMAPKPPVVLYLLPGFASPSEWLARRNRDIATKNILKTQLQTGAIEKPSIASSAKDSGAISVALKSGEGKHMTVTQCRRSRNEHVKPLSTAKQNAIKGHRQSYLSFPSLRPWETLDRTPCEYD